MAIEKVRVKRGMGGSRGGRGRTAKTDVYKKAGKKLFRRESRQMEKEG